MRITLQSKLSRGDATEGSAFTVTAKFYDDSSDPWTLSAPTTIRYRIDNLDTGNSVLDWISATPATSVSIAITGAQNLTQSQYRPFERHQLTVQANAGLATQCAETHNFQVNNVLGIT